MVITTQTSNKKIVADTYAAICEEVRHYFARYTGNLMEAEDMTQDLFLKLLNRDFICGDTVRNLVFTMAKRMVIDDARHKMFVRKATEGYRMNICAYDNNSPAQRLQTRELHEWEQRFLSEMAPKRARVYEMCHHREMSAKEIAAEMGLSPRTVETHIYLSTKEMRSKMRQVV